MLYEFLSSNREELISRCRAKVVKRSAPQPTGRELEYGIPVFLNQLTEMLREESLGLEAGVAGGLSETTGPTKAIGDKIEEIAGTHGYELLMQGFTVHQVVLDYGDLCQVVTELAIERSAAITVDEFHTLNRCLDDAVASAVSEFARQFDRIMVDAGERTIAERTQFLANEYRSLIDTALFAVDAIKLGNDGIAGPTGGVLERSLTALRDLTSRSFGNAGTEAAIPGGRTHVLVSEFIKEIQVWAAIDARARGLELIVPDVEPELAMEVDRDILAAALADLVQMAFKFTTPHSSVSLNAFSLADRVLIVVEDECGGVPDAGANLFQSFEQRSGEQSGLGLGLGLIRHGVEVNGGMLHVDNLPGRGRVFTIDLPNPAAEAAPRTNAPLEPAA